MARTILAAVAALCALASVSAFSALPDPRPEPQQLPPQLQQLSLQLGHQLEKLLPSELGLQLEKALGSELLQSPQNLKEGAQGLLTVAPRVIHSSVDDNTVKGTKQVLQASSGEVALEATQQAVEPDALQIADQLNDDVEEWLDKASVTGADVSDCVDDRNANLTDVVKTFQRGAEECFNSTYEDAKVIASGVVETLNEVKRILRDGITEFVECVKQLKFRSIHRISACEVRANSRTLVKFAGLRTDTLSVAVDNLPLLVHVSKCTAMQSTSALAKASHIVNATISCIEGKLSSQPS